MSMKSVKVVVTTPIEDECLKQIADVNPRIEVTDASDLYRAEVGGDLKAKEKLDALLAEAEVAYGLRLPRNLISRAPQLKWVQVMAVGANRYLDDEMRRSPVVLTCARGIHATQIGEFVLMLMLMFVKQTPFCFQLKQEKRWQQFPPAVLHNKTVGIVGLGSIGRGVARLARAFGMRVLATRRSIKRAGTARYVDLVLPIGQLEQLLAESYFVVLSVPLTAETKEMIGERELRAMKATAYLINIARGDVVDEVALIRALEENWIAGAGLDVFATEPLPADSRLWDLPNVIFSPHVSGNMEGYNQRATELFADNLERYLDGRRLLNVVDKERGY